MSEVGYEAYVYRWTHKITNKKYIGYHKGSILDPYDTSATCQEMIDAFGEGNLEIEIVAEGTVEDMIALERDMLLEVDARNNDEYYNKSNGGGAALKNYIKPSLDTLQESIVSRSFEVQTIKKEEIATYDKFQVRFNEIDTKHVKILRDKIDDKNGDTSGFVPINVLQDYNGKGQHLVLDGNHRIVAAMNSLRCRYLPVQFIPKSVYKEFKTIELKALANRLNPQPDKPAKSGNKYDAVKFLLERYDGGNGLSIMSDQNLVEMHHYWGWSKRDAVAAQKQAMKIVENQSAIPAGAVWINWPVSRKKQLDAIVEQYRDSDTIAIHASSGGFRLDRLLAISCDFPKKTKAVVVISHPNPSAKKNWERDHLPAHEKTIKTRVNMKVEFVDLPTIDYNAGLQDSEDVE
tara:strand:+ start:804 stop:2015 length:1212 start_codon:yes stop_codon:yes gene_type:complete